VDYFCHLFDVAFVSPIHNNVFQAKSWEAKLEKANSMVPTIILQNASTEFLDLHYVYVSEALEVNDPVILVVIPLLNSIFKQILDLFLDWHVQRRMNNPSVGTEMVEIVTGRGNRSEGGKAKIKPAVIKRLKQRDVKSVSDFMLNAFEINLLQLFQVRGVQPWCAKGVHQQRTEIQYKQGH
jgi:hypothetical protein